jgi:hypothetical protein
MKKQIGILILLVGIFSGSLHAQTMGKRNSLGIMFHVKYLLQKDKVFSKVPRKSLLYGLTLDYTHYNSYENFYKIELGGNVGIIKSVTSPIKGNEIGAFFAFSSLYKIHSNSNDFRYWYGPKLKFDLDAILSDNIDALRYAWDILISVNPTFKIDYAASHKIGLSYETDFNAIGILWRPHAQGYILKTEELLETKGITAALFETPRFSSLHNAFKWNNRLTFNYELSKSFGLQSIYNIDYSSIKVPRKKRSLSSRFGIGSQYKF